MISSGVLRRMGRSFGVGAVCCAVAMAWAGQGLAQAPKDWRAFEADQRTLDFRSKLRENNFSDDGRAFLTDIALPQLELPANRDTIDRVRRRIRELLAADPSLPTIVDYTTKVARDEAKPLVVRVNAMLLLAELAGRDRRPWPGAAQPLVAALGDTALPPAVRVAAAAGLSRHMSVAGKSLAASAGPVLIEAARQAARADAATVDPVAADWLAGRAFTIFEMLGADAPAETVDVASAIVADEERPLDLRVRAAAALGAVAAEGRAIDAAAALSSIRDLAVAVVREARDLSKQSAAPAGMGFGGGGYADPTMGGLPDPAMLGGGVPPGGGGLGGPFGGSPEGYAINPSGMPMPANDGLQLAFRRSAWRLAKLADAVGTDDRKAGLVVVAGPLQPKALQMAAALRNAATSIDTTPSGATVEKAYQLLAGAEAANSPNGAAEPAKPAPAPAPPKPANAQGAAAPNAAQPAAEVNPFAQ